MLKLKKAKKTTDNKRNPKDERNFSSKYGNLPKDKIEPHISSRISREVKQGKNPPSKKSIRNQIIEERRNKIIEKRKKPAIPFKNSAIKSLNQGVVNKNPKKRRKLFTLTNFLFLLIPALLIAIIIAFVQTKIFDVHNIVISGVKNINAPELRKYVETKGGNGLIFNISPARLKNSIEQDFGFVRSVTISKDLPSTLTIQIEEYDPYAIVQSKNNAYLLSKEGIILYKNIDVEVLKAKYPVVILDSDSEYKIKDVFSTEVLNNSIKAVELANLESNVTNVVVKLYPDNSADATITFTNGKMWILTLTKKDLSMQYAILKQVGVVKNYKTLDTRFTGSYIIN